MANYSELLDQINDAIYENNDQEIDALEVRAILREMVTSLGSGFLFKGIATPSSPSGTGTYEPDQNVFYLATTAGTYTYLDGLVVAAGEVAFLCFDGTWTKKSSALLSTGSIVDNTTTEDATKPLSAKQGKVLADAGAATAAEVSALGHEVDEMNAKLSEETILALGTDDTSAAYTNNTYDQYGLAEYTQKAVTDVYFDSVQIRGINLATNASCEYRVYLYSGAVNAYGVPTGEIGVNHTLLKSGTLQKEGTGRKDYTIDFDSIQRCPAGSNIIVYLVGSARLFINCIEAGGAFDYNYALFTTASSDLWNAQWYDGATTYKVRSLFAILHQTFATKAEANILSGRVYELEKKTITENEFVLGTDDTSVQNDGYYDQYGLAEYTQKAVTDVYFDSVQIRGINLATNASCEYRVYLYSGAVNAYGVPTGKIGVNHTLLKSGTLHKKADGFNDYDIIFDSLQTCPAGSNIIVYLAAAERIRLAEPAAGGSFTYNYQLFTTASTDIWDAQWYDGATDYQARSLFVYLSQTFVTIDQLNEILSEGAFGTILPEEIIVPNGDTLQIYYRGLMGTPNPYVYDIVSVCSVGKSYPRYFELTAGASMVGNEYALEISARDKDGNTISRKSTIIRVIAQATSPLSAKKILCVGDSTTSGGEWPAELKRRLTESSGSGTPANPTGLGLSNVSFVGRKEKNGVHFEASGGVKVKHYATQGENALRFSVSGITQLYLGDTYTINGMILNLQEINVTAGSGNIKFTLLSAMATIPASGTLVRQSGNGDATISYSSYTQESYNPFWNENTSELDFSKYANDWCGGSIDYIAFLIGVNDIVSGATNDTTLNYYKTIIRAYLSAFPSGKVLLLSVPAGSPNGGYGANYGASARRNFYSIAEEERAFAEGLMEICSDAEFSGSVEYVPCLEEFDCEFGYPAQNTPVNNRATQTEPLGTNAVHPTTQGYYLIADAVYRTISNLL